MGRREFLILSMAVVAGMGALLRPGLPVQAEGPEMVLRLRYATFDPLRQRPDIPSSWRRPLLAEDQIANAIVQFTGGPVQPEWPLELIRSGVQIAGYIPDNAFLVRGNPALVSSLRSLANVRWVGSLEPAYRVDPSLLLEHQGASVLIHLFPGEDAQPVQAALVAQGGRLERAQQGPQGAWILRAWVPGTGLSALAALPSVEWIEPVRPLRLWNDVARRIMNVTPVWTMGGLQGAGQIIALADTGLDTGVTDTVHIDLRPRLLATHAWGRPNDWSDPNGHGTHVAGIAVGTGAASGAIVQAQPQTFAGVAPQASLVMQSVLDAQGGLGGIPDDLGLLLQQAYEDGARIHSNSWGIDVSAGGYAYDGLARSLDDFVWTHPDMVVVVAAGNGGRDQDRDGHVDSQTIGTPATAKNILAVGASESLRLQGGYNPDGPCATYGECWPQDFPTDPLASDPLSNNPNGLAAFSGRGPAPDGRIKPDLVAPGTNIVSTRSSLAGEGTYWSTYDTYYAIKGGTSMAAPMVAGAAALVRQALANQGVTDPSAALVKAFLIAGAIDLAPGQYDGWPTPEIPQAPNNAEGWGRVDVANAILPTTARAIAYVDRTPGLITGAQDVFTYTLAHSGVPLRVTLAWSDPPPVLAAARQLVNDLDLSITGPSGQVWPQHPDHLNNVEGVMIDLPDPGVYTITVTGTNVPLGPQPYALVVSGGLEQPSPPPTISVTAPTIAMVGAPTTIRWIVGGGKVVTDSQLLWDTTSHAQDSLYAFHVPGVAIQDRTYVATVAMPMTGTVYYRPQAWVDGMVISATEGAITAANLIYRHFFPLLRSAPAPPMVVPTTPIQIVQNGGFEDQPPQAPPWDQWDAQRPDPLVSPQFAWHSGHWGAWLGGYNHANQRLSQTILVPPGVSSAILSFWVYVTSEETGGTSGDRLSVSLRGMPEATVIQLDHRAGANRWTRVSYTWTGNFSRYAGYPVDLIFRATTDDQRVTSFWIDDVSLVVAPRLLTGNLTPYTPPQADGQGQQKETRKDGR